MQTKVVKQNGVPYIAIDSKVIETLAFKSFRPTANNVSDFYKAGIRIFHVYVSGLTPALKVPYSQYGETWFGDGDYRFEALDKQIKLFADNAPDAYVFINVHLDALARMGAPYDLYSLNDIDRVDAQQYKLFVFLDALYLTDAQRTYINRVLKGGGRSLLFIGACDYVSDADTFLDRVSALAEMDVGILEADETTVCAQNSTYG